MYSFKFNLKFSNPQTLITNNFLTQTADLDPRQTDIDLTKTELDLTPQTRERDILLKFNFLKFSNPPKPPFITNNFVRSYLYIQYIEGTTELVII